MGDPTDQPDPHSQRVMAATTVSKRRAAGSLRPRRLDERPMPGRGGASPPAARGARLSQAGPGRRRRRTGRPVIDHAADRPNPSGRRDQPADHHRYPARHGGLSAHRRPGGAARRSRLPRAGDLMLTGDRTGVQCDTCTRPADGRLSSRFDCKTRAWLGVDRGHRRGTGEGESAAGDELGLDIVVGSTDQVSAAIQLDGRRTARAEVTWCASNGPSASGYRCAMESQMPPS